MSKLNSLKSAATLSDVATLLQFKPSSLSYVLFRQPAAAKYKTFQIPKRNGATRTIKAPIDALKLVQRRLSTLLQDCVDEINLVKNRKDRIAHGFKRKRSIITNARQHRNRRYVFNLDLQDFFPSINFGRVRGYFIRDNTFALDQDVATVIAQIACHENALPQGSPCSPVISNLIAHMLDTHLVRLASKVGCTYSRYADDLTFSTNKKDFPPEIATPSETVPHRWVPGTELQRLITNAGFRINPLKTHMNYRTSRQEVTGLVVNRKINVRTEYRHDVRAMVHSLLQQGSFDLYGVSKKAGGATVEKRQGTVNELHGMLGFIDSIDLYNKKIAPKSKDSDKLSKKELMYKRFLIYKDFYAAEAPVIICEGSTDNVYLTHAIRSLAAEYPDLAEITGDKIRLRLRLYKYPQSSTARILGLRDGGSSALATFIATYKTETMKFNAPGLKKPVIVVYDNDSGAGNIRDVLKKEFNSLVNRALPYLHVFRNMYAVPTPLPCGANESKIEDFFDAPTRATVIDGKTFNCTNEFDASKHYGKKIFAHRVVREKADSINFEGFRPLLNNLVAVINSHAKAVSGVPAEPST
ncbi:MAG TPA: retron Ec67 family RNA-directed DNA polymerase/endonuclease [Bryobacteraceae bacterium]|nr:retron Ec67 family RNA-directed DNA polymerase/endonuclease [Bryobacteraceae bacterium]